jgi:hypothetical protein
LEWPPVACELRRPRSSDTLGLPRWSVDTPDITGWSRETPALDRYSI